MQHPNPAIDLEDIGALIAPHIEREGPMLPMLHAVQAAYGFIPREAVGVIAETLNQTKAEVHGVISFYQDFRDAPAGRHVVKICRAEACQAVGGSALADATLGNLGVDWGGTSTDGKVTVEPVYCLGLCACGPAAMVDEQVVGRLDEERMTALLRELRT